MYAVMTARSNRTPCLILKSPPLIACTSEQCHKLDTGVCSSQNMCNYTYAYASASITQGVLAQAAVTFTSTGGQPLSLQGVFLVVDITTLGGFNDHEMGIIIGLGGAVSLISQMGSSLGGGNKFSQCLVPFHTDNSISSKICFGSGSEVSGDGVVSTPLVATEEKTPYFVTLQGISVGDKYLPFGQAFLIVLHQLLQGKGDTIRPEGSDRQEY